MSDEMTIEDYLEQGGVLTSPGNAPPRYRAELMRLMATFVDSEMAGASGFADIITTAPGITERIAAARIVLEKFDHAERVLKIMGEFGANTEQYAKHHPWTSRLERNADIGASRQGSDMRLSVFHYPIEGWIDAVVMNVLMGRAVRTQLEEFSHASYQPLAEAFRAILPREIRHAELGEEGLRELLEDKSNKAVVQASVSYWWPRIAASFGTIGSEKFSSLKAIGIRHRSNEDLLADWEKDAGALMKELGLKAG
ncbi:MAG: Phenylacetic acid catabolic protein [Hyphomicrobiales bacterium]